MYGMEGLLSGAMTGAHSLGGVVSGAIQGANQQSPGMQQAIQGSFESAHAATMARNQAVSQLQASLMKQGLSPEQAFKQANSQIGASAFSPGQGPLSVFPSQPGQPGSAPQQQQQNDGSFSIAGQQYDAEVAARNARVGQNSLVGQQSQGSVMVPGGGQPGAAATDPKGSAGGFGGGSLPAGGFGSMISGGGPPQFQAQGMQPINSIAPGQQQQQGPQPQQNMQNPGLLGMQQANPQATLAGYQQTPGYQLLFGQQGHQQFQQSPGYQYAVDQAMQQVQRAGASRGLLESGSVMREMTDRAQNMANQEYGNWWNRQAQQYGDYQNRLAGLASGNTGAEYAMKLGEGQGQTAFNAGLGTATLLGNQGNSGLSGYANIGAAQAGNLLNAGNTQAQVNSNNQSTLLAGALYQQPRGY